MSTLRRDTRMTVTTSRGPGVGVAFTGSGTCTNGKHAHEERHRSDLASSRSTVTFMASPVREAQRRSGTCARTLHSIRVIPSSEAGWWGAWLGAKVPARTIHAAADAHQSMICRPGLECLQPLALAFPSMHARVRGVSGLATSAVVDPRGI